MRLPGGLVGWAEAGAQAESARRRGRRAPSPLPLPGVEGLLGLAGPPRPQRGENRVGRCPRCNPSSQPCPPSRGPRLPTPMSSSSLTPGEHRIVLPASVLLLHLSGTAHPSPPPSWIYSAHQPPPRPTGHCQALPPDFSGPCPTDAGEPRAAEKSTSQISRRKHTLPNQAKPVNGS